MITKYRKMQYWFIIIAHVINVNIECTSCYLFDLKKISNGIILQKVEEKMPKLCQNNNNKKKQGQWSQFKYKTTVCNI